MAAAQVVASRALRETAVAQAVLATAVVRGVAERPAMAVAHAAAAVQDHQAPDRPVRVLRPHHRLRVVRSASVGIRTSRRRPAFRSSPSRKRFVDGLGPPGPGSRIRRKSPRLPSGPGRPAAKRVTYFDLVET